MTVKSTADITTNRRGITQLTRYWEADEPWASMLIVHGLGEHSGRYERTGGLFAEAGIDTRSLDLIGFGGSAGDRAYVESWSHYLEDIADQLTPAFSSGLPTVLLGHSLGGLIAATYVLSLNRQTDYVVLSAPALAHAGWEKKAAPVMGRVAPKLLIPNSIKGEQLSRDPAVGEAYFADPLVFTKSSAALGSAIFEQMDRVEHHLDAFGARTLVIHGGMDSVMPPTATVAIGGLPNVDRKLYPHLRHELFNEPEGPEVAADVVAWLRAQVDA